MLPRVQLTSRMEASDRLSPEMYAAMSVDERAVAVHKHLPAGLVVLVAAALHEAALRFPHSARMQLFIARFYQASVRVTAAAIHPCVNLLVVALQVLAGQPSRAMGHLVRALRLGAPLDVEFEVYATRRIVDSQVRSDPRYGLGVAAPSQLDRTFRRLAWMSAAR